MRPVSHRRLLPLAILAVVPLAACAPPTLTAFDRSQGAPHDLVMVQGADLAFSTIEWDGSTIPGGFLGAYMFSVPPGASEGPHAVTITNSSGRSDPLTFTVKAADAPFPKPRIDYVTLLGAYFDNAGQVTAGLYVQGANFDVGAVVQVGGADVATHSHQGLRADWHGVSVADFGYPIHHYLSTIALAGVRTAGATLELQVRNRDGQMSDPFPYTLPSDAASMDSDGDALLDSWETKGYDADGDGVIDVDLPALGTDPYRRDVLVELDLMDNIQSRPGPEVFDGARAMYRSAPILNLSSESGINLILDTSGKPCLQAPDGTEVCSFQTICFDAFTSAGAGCTDAFTYNEARFSDLKAQSFDDARRGKMFHYGIWGISKDDGYSGQSDFADDFVVAFDLSAKYPPSYQTPRSHVELLTHELGHDLNQRHGGVDAADYKPNYLSVMSYSWVFRTARSRNSWRVDHPTCLPFYYANKDAAEAGGAVPGSLVVPPGSTNQVPTTQYLVLDYSEGMARPLMVTNGADGQLCGVTIVWPGVGLPDGEITDFANWRDLKFDGPALNERRDS